ncbi:3-oxoacyl-[acyl-carrier-protein] synthase III [Pseudodesulfovibrio profundus]|uniref:Beta-ketoacyl-[acyl-carrier-protein] synthase III n=1 Tax=Pseudodesulfovibrio profundus TaxID=57320 RepID=A0A2C8FC06_9BACT|nr:beta-ketoacyl-ACP synthase III [Pseudodesulfovibrio profundus]MBC15801.1 3-oxoacyl-ACP synthase [Desulfovibrio sp.]SOB59592.1 3-oxoacyl-[acyl-carrier-protein] synthase III [Pseudodesulfovibrio profundus]|tara:strand:- start:11955 stop:12944 length:990 start_codon:yes stop_codon:yes gene_type:complete
MKTNFIIRGLGMYAPERVVTNVDLEKIVDTSDEWITTRTGIRQRHVVAEDEAASDMAYEAAKKALANAGMEADELTHIVCGTFTPDAIIPSTACRVQEKLGITGQMCIDVQAACSGFLYAMQTARGYLALEPESKVLVVTSEVISRRLNWEDRTTCVLFGDAAGAAIITTGEADETPRIVDVILAADGSLGDLLTVNGGGSAHSYKKGETVGDEYFVQMQGRDIFKHAVRNMVGISEKLLAKHGIDKNDVDVLIPHQANLRIIDAVGRKFDIPEEKVFSNIDRYGNTSAASVPVALTEAVETGFVKKGDLVLMPTFGGGFTWGAGLIQF